MKSENRVTRDVITCRSSDSGTSIAGYALKYNKMSQNLGGFVEQCAPGLADKSIADKADVLCRFQHADEFLLGRVGADTLTLDTDGTGVLYDCPLPDTDYASNVRALAARGDLRYSSFTFETLEDEWDFTEQGFPMRTLIAIRLIDVAPVVSPAYLDTTSGLRSLADKRGLDIEAVKAAAEINELGVLMRTGDPTHIDLGNTGTEMEGQRATHPPVALLHRQLLLANMKAARHAPSNIDHTDSKEKAS